MSTPVFSGIFAPSMKLVFQPFEIQNEFFSKIIKKVNASFPGRGPVLKTAGCHAGRRPAPRWGWIAALFDDQALFLFLVRHRRRLPCPASRTGNGAQASAAGHNDETDLSGQPEHQKGARHGKDDKRDFKHDRLPGFCVISADQHGVAVGKKAVAALHSLGIQGEHSFPAGQGRDKHEQR